jgi:hypothetical protein
MTYLIPLIGEVQNKPARQGAIQMRLDVEVQSYARYQDWCKREADAYHTILKYLFARVSTQVAGIGTSQALWTDLEERYEQTKLATYCELFAQLRDTTGPSCKSAREFVDRIRLLVNRLNAITPGCIGDQAHIALLLTQIGSEYAFIVDAMQNFKSHINPTAVGNRLANAERTVRGRIQRLRQQERRPPRLMQ